MMKIILLNRLSIISEQMVGYLHKKISSTLQKNIFYSIYNITKVQLHNKLVTLNLKGANLSFLFSQNCFKSQKKQL